MRQLVKPATDRLAQITLLSLIPFVAIPVVLELFAFRWHARRLVCFALFFMVLAFATETALAAWRDWLRWHRREAGLCPACGYDLRATPERCPECGLVTDG